MRLYLRGHNKEVVQSFEFQKSPIQPLPFSFHSEKNACGELMVNHALGPDFLEEICVQSLIPAEDLPEKKFKIFLPSNNLLTPFQDMNQNET